MTTNLLIIMSDEHQSRAIGRLKHPFVKTPQLDRLVDRGMTFTNAYTPSPICVPARAAFATGRYVHDIRLWDNAMPYAGRPSGWGHKLQQRGIPVESIGKLHYRSEEDPAGFDVEHIPMNVVGGHGMVWGSIRREDERTPRDSRMLGQYIGPGTSKYTDYDDAVVARTSRWFAERRSMDKVPWCLYVGLVAPHFPLIVPQEFYDLYPLDSLPEPKLAPQTGFVKHPWVDKQNQLMDSESKFVDASERKRAIASYFGLCSWLDHNVGRILDSLQQNGFGENTTVIYTSDHGDNVGARGLWGKSNMYEESVAIPMIMSVPGMRPARCHTPVSLIDLSSTICDHFDTSLDLGAPGRSLYATAKAADEPERVVFSEYHAVGSVSGAFMIRKGRWKYIHYVGFEPELFDLEDDPEELNSLAQDEKYKGVVACLREELLSICDPESTSELAYRDQRALIEKFGGVEAASNIGAPGATPPPANVAG